MTLDAHVTGIWCGQIGGGVGNFGNPHVVTSANPQRCEQLTRPRVLACSHARAARPTRTCSLRRHSQNGELMESEREIGIGCVYMMYNTKCRIYDIQYMIYNI